MRTTVFETRDRGVFAVAFLVLERGRTAAVKKMTTTTTRSDGIVMMSHFESLERF